MQPPPGILGRWHRRCIILTAFGEHPRYTRRTAAGAPLPFAVYCAGFDKVVTAKYKRDRCETADGHQVYYADNPIDMVECHGCLRTSPLHGVVVCIMSGRFRSQLFRSGHNVLRSCRTVLRSGRNVLMSDRTVLRSGRVATYLGPIATYLGPVATYLELFMY